MSPLAIVARQRVAGGFGITGAKKRSLTVDHTKVPTTLSNFPVLVSLSHSTLKTVANGGHVQRSDGFDIGFYSDAGITTKLAWEMEKYDGAAGTIVAWVKIAALSSATDTVFYMGYGDPAITTDSSDAANVWVASYLGVYHLGDGTTLNVNSSTGSNNGTNHSATAVAGKVDGGASLVTASSQYIDLGNAINPTTTITQSAWVKATSYPNGFNAAIVRNDGGASITGTWIKSDGHLAPYYNFSGGSVGSAGSHTMVTGTWYYVAVTYSSTLGMFWYVDAASDGSGAANGTMAAGAAFTFIGRDEQGGNYWNGLIDEVHIASVARTADWITAEFNNQNSPGTFLALGSEV